MKDKEPRIRLGLLAYRNLKQSVLTRDGWRCQKCGVSANLEVHHITPRNLLGHDKAENLITLCARCHRKSHGRETTASAKVFRGRSNIDTK